MFQISTSHQTSIFPDPYLARKLSPRTSNMANAEEQSSSTGGMLGWTPAGRPSLTWATKLDVECNCTVGWEVIYVENGGRLSFPCL